MSVHEQFGEDLALYAIGALDSDTKSALESHLTDCASCRRELEQWRGDAALLALSTAGPKPPARSRVRLVNALNKEQRSERRPVNLALWWGALGWLAAGLAIVAAVTLWRQNQHLKISSARTVEFFERERLMAAKDRIVAEILQAPDATRYTVMPVSLRTPPPPSGKAIYSRERGLVFIASNLNSTPALKAYELWLIPATGAPIPAGVFKPDAHGNATIINPPLPSGVEAKAFAVTIEPEQGSTTPTMPIVMMGAGG